MKPFAELGALISDRWRKENYSEELFPAIAAQALAESDLTAKVDPWEIIRWVHTTPDLPRQQDRNAKFGDPPITLFVGPRFYIDVYFWLDGTTMLHQHNFSGAFQVLLGSSVHSSYSFEQEREINPYFLIGKVSLQNVSLLTKGTIKEIRPGQHFIHSLFHLERPSATITVRSNHAPHDAIQYSYLKPYLAFDPFFEDDSLSKKVQTVSLLLSMKHTEADRFVGDLLAEADFQTAFFVLDTAFGFLGNDELEEIFQLSKSADRFSAMLDRARARHGDLVDLLPPVFAEKRRQLAITKRRGMIKDEQLRFFLALLLNIPERSLVLDLIKQRFPDDDPIDKAAAWFKEMSATRIFGSPEPNVLGIKDVDETHHFVFRGLLQGWSDDEIQAGARVQLFSKGIPERSLAETAKSIRTLPLFKALFS
ncbi:MAG: hypothetical protein ACR2H4_17710 [Pyrinomonadaceae bacterium]